MEIIELLPKHLSHSGISSHHRWSRFHQLYHIWLQVATMNELQQGPDPSTTLMIQVVNVACQLRPCITFLLRTELNSDYGMFHFCIADTEHDWREGSEQYQFIEKFFASANRHKQPWLIFAAHRVLGYSSDTWYVDGGFEEPMGRDDMQKLWQRYKVDIAFYGHVHSSERICPIYQNQCVNSEISNYTGTVNGTIHVVVGGAGSHLSDFSSVETAWSIYQDRDFGYTKLTAYNHSSLHFEYMKSRGGKVYDSFTISRDYKDVLACVHDGCEPTTLAT